MPPPSYPLPALSAGGGKCFLPHLHSAGGGVIFNPQVKHGKRKFPGLLWSIFSAQFLLTKKESCPMSVFSPSLSL